MFQWLAKMLSSFFYPAVAQKDKVEGVEVGKGGKSLELSKESVGSGEDVAVAAGLHQRKTPAVAG